MLFNFPCGAVEPSFVRVAGHRLFKQHFASGFDYAHQSFRLSGNPIAALDFGIRFPNVSDESIRDIIIRFTLFFDADALPIDRTTLWLRDWFSSTLLNFATLSTRLAQVRVSFRCRVLNRDAAFRANRRDSVCLRS